MTFTEISIPVQLIIGGIYGLLLIASIVNFVLIKTSNKPIMQEVWLKVKTWWVMATLFLFAIFINRAISLVFFAFLSFMALKEYLTLIPTRKVDRSILFWVYLAIPLQYLWVHMHWYGMFIIFIPVYLLLFLPTCMVITGQPAGYVKAIATLHWGAMVTIFCLSHVACLLILPHHPNSLAGGAGLVLFLVVLTETNDIAQFLSGKNFGRRKVVPSISPNKTWEGLIGGIIVTTILALLLAPWLTPLTIIQSIFIGLLIGLGGFLGDVTISAMKRDMKVKDSSHLLPGHGGILDRVDSLTYTAPLFFHALYYLHY